MSALDIAQHISDFIFLSVIVGIPGYAVCKKVKVYESFIAGAQDSFQVTLRIIPYLIAMLVAIGMLRASGAFELLARIFSPLLSQIGMPTDILPLALIRPFSGSAATGMMADIIKTNGGDAYISQLAATIMGSTETTFYVIAIYFGTVNIHRTRHAIPAGLVADLVGVLASLWICRILFA